MKGPPSIISGNETLFGKVGNSYHIICEAEAVPRIKSFQWTFKGKDLSVINPISDEYTIVDTEHGRIRRSSLIIESVTSQHFGEYRCSARNDLGVTGSVILFKPSGNFH